jgi:hypothetical protein
MNGYTIQTWLSANTHPTTCTVAFGLLAAAAAVAIVAAVTWSAVRFVDSDE